MKAEELPHRWLEKMKEWATLDEAARKLDELKKACLAEIFNREEGAIGVRENAALASKRYQDYVYDMCEAKTKANVAKAEADAMKMLWETWRSKNATKREEMRL